MNLESFSASGTEVNVNVSEVWGREISVHRYVSNDKDSQSHWLNLVDKRSDRTWFSTKAAPGHLTSAQVKYYEHIT